MEFRRFLGGRNTAGNKQIVLFCRRAIVWRGLMTFGAFNHLKAETFLISMIYNVI